MVVNGEKPTRTEPFTAEASTPESFSPGSAPPPPSLLLATPGADGETARGGAPAAGGGYRAVAPALPSTR